MNQRAPDVAPHFLPGKWKCQCALNGSIDLGREIQSKSRLARFISFDSFIEFHLGFRVKDIIHFS